MNWEEQFLTTLAQWDHFEKEKNGPLVIDFNLVNKTVDQNPYKHRFEILIEFERLLETAGAVDPRLQKKLAANIYYLRALMGQVYSLEEYVNNTLHVPVRCYGADHLDAALENIKAVLSDFDLSFSAKTNAELDALEPMLAAQDLNDCFLEIFRKSKPTLENLLGLNCDFKLNLEVVEVEAYWTCWVDGQGDSFNLKLNAWQGGFTKSKVIKFAFHELLAHGCQMSAWREQISKNQLSPLWGLTNVHGPDIFLCEGLAETMPMFLDNEYSREPLAILRNQLNHYIKLTNNDLHMMINAGSSIEDCLAYLHKYQPWLDTDKALPNISDRVQNTLFRCYEYVYPCGTDFFYQLGLTLSDAQKQDLLRRVYSQVLLYEDLQQLAQNYKQDLAVLKAG